MKCFIFLILMLSVQTVFAVKPRLNIVPPSEGSDFRKPLVSPIVGAEKFDLQITDANDDPSLGFSPKTLEGIASMCGMTLEELRKQRKENEDPDNPKNTKAPLTPMSEDIQRRFPKGTDAENEVRRKDSKEFMQLWTESQ